MARRNVDKRVGSESDAFVRVAVLDDHRLSRDAVVQALERHDRLTVCLATGRATPISELCAVAPCAVAIHAADGADLSVDCIVHVRRNLPHARVVSYSFTPLSTAIVEDMAALGAIAHVNHDASPGQLADAVFQAASMDAADALPAISATPSMAGLAPMFDPHVLGLRVRKHLSEQELLVWSCLGQGLSCRDVAQHLGIDYRTVSTYCCRIRAKLRLSDSVKLGCLAAQAPAAPAGALQPCCGAPRIQEPGFRVQA
jgi:DNA-binding NarL/FixJ family response regulator